MKNDDLIRTELIKMIMNHNTRLAINSVGGYENFKRVMDIDSPLDFLNIFNDLTTKRVNNMLYFNYDNSNKMVLDMNHNILFLRESDFEPLNLFYTSPMTALIEKWSHDNYNLNISTYTIVNMV